MRKWAFSVVVLIGLVPWALADPGYDGAIVDEYVKNLRGFLRKNNLETIQLPDFDLFPGKYWNVRWTDGSFGNLSTVGWADEATVTKNDDVVHVVTSLYIPDPHIRYKMTLFEFFELTTDVKVITNAVHIDVDVNTTDCTISFNRIEIYYFENIFPEVLFHLLDNPLVPKEFAAVVESGIAVGIKITNFVFNIVIKPYLTNQLSQLVTAASEKFNLCPIFESS